MGPMQSIGLSRGDPMRIPSNWPLLLTQLVLAFAFCHLALGFELWLCALLTALTLHPLTWPVPALLALHGIINAADLATSAAILLPLVGLAYLTYLAQTPLTRATDRRAGDVHATN